MLSILKMLNYVKFNLNVVFLFVSQNKAKHCRQKVFEFDTLKANRKTKFVWFFFFKQKWNKISCCFFSLSVERSLLVSHKVCITFVSLHICLLLYFWENKKLSPLNKKVLVCFNLLSWEWKTICVSALNVYEFMATIENRKKKPLI